MKASTKTTNLTPTQYSGSGYISSNSNHLCFLLCIVPLGSLTRSKTLTLRLKREWMWIDYRCSIIQESTRWISGPQWSDKKYGNNKDNTNITNSIEWNSVTENIPRVLNELSRKIKSQSYRLYWLEREKGTEPASNVEHFCWWKFFCDSWFCSWCWKNKTLVGFKFVKYQQFSWNFTNNQSLRLF